VFVAAQPAVDVMSLSIVPCAITGIGKLCNIEMTATFLRLPTMIALFFYGDLKTPSRS